MSSTVSSNPFSKGKRITLKSGEDIYVVAWGWDDAEQNIASIYELFIDVISDGGGNGTDVPPDANRVARIIQRGLKKLRPLIEASLKNGADDLAKLQGLNDLSKVITGVIEENEIVEGLGNLMGAVSRFADAMSLTLPQMTSPVISVPSKG